MTLRREDYKLLVDMKPRWSDMDAFGHVNNAVYFTYFENARLPYFDMIGLELGQGGSCGPILASTSCDYKKPLTYEIAFQVGLRAVHLGNSSFTLDFAIFGQNSDELYATGRGVIVWIDLASGRSQPLPEVIREGLKADMSSRAS